jgi:protein-S-isoprenylcysteine O-methyltransferase Ste14
VFVHDHRTDEAALSEDHELVQTGPYRWIRHPIYASILGMLLATGNAWTWWPMFVDYSFVENPEVNIANDSISSFKVVSFDPV